MTEVVVPWWQLELQDMQSSSQIVTTNKPTPNFLQARCPSCHPTQQHQSTEGKLYNTKFYQYVTINFVILTE